MKLILVLALSIALVNSAATADYAAAANASGQDACTNGKFIPFSGATAPAQANTAAGEICVPTADLGLRCNLASGAATHGCTSAQTCYGETSALLGFCTTTLPQKCVAATDCATGFANCVGSPGTMVNTALTASTGLALVTGYCSSASSAGTKCFYTASCTGGKVCQGATGYTAEGDCTAPGSITKWVTCDTTANPCTGYTGVTNCINNFCGVTAETCQVATESTDCSGTKKKCMVVTGQTNGVCGTDGADCTTDAHCALAANTTAGTVKCVLAAANTFASYEKAKTGTCTKKPCTSANATTECGTGFECKSAFCVKASASGGSGSNSTVLSFVSVLLVAVIATVL